MASLQEVVTDLKHWRDETAATVRKITKFAEKLGSPEMLLARLDELEGKRLSPRKYEENRAALLHPFTYRVDVPIAALSVARASGQVTISQEGYFFCDTIRCSWLATGVGYPAGVLNHWIPLSMANPFIAGSLGLAGPVVLAAHVPDFWWEYVEGRAELGRQNLQIPGDVFYRSDEQCYHVPGEGDMFGPNSAITFYATPTVAMGATLGGTLTFSLHGIQCRGVMKK